MSSRPLIAPFPAIINGNMASNITSSVTIIQMLSMASYQINWTGATPVGTITVQASNDYAQNADGTVKNAGNWTTLPLSSTTGVSGNTGTGFIDIDASAGYALRLTYTATSGTGTMNATLIGKVA